jgi:hypothetical protein
MTSARTFFVVMGQPSRGLTDTNTVPINFFNGQDSLVGIATDYGLDDRMMVRIPAGAVNFSLRHRVQIGSGAHPTSYSMDTGSPFSGGKAAGA